MEKSQKIENKYDFISYKLKKLRSVDVRVMPIIGGSLGIVPKTTESRMKEMEIQERTEFFSKAQRCWCL